MSISEQWQTSHFTVTHMVAVAVAVAVAAAEQKEVSWKQNGNKKKRAVLLAWFWTSPTACWVLDLWLGLAPARIKILVYFVNYLMAKGRVKYSTESLPAVWFRNFISVENKTIFFVKCFPLLSKEKKKWERLNEENSMEKLLIICEKGFTQKSVRKRKMSTLF